jgi:hypothetical protein
MTDVLGSFTVATTKDRYVALDCRTCGEEVVRCFAYENLAILVTLAHDHRVRKHAEDER